MALLDHDDLAAMVAAIGADTIATSGTAELAVVFNREGAHRLDGEIIERVGPYCVAVEVDVEALVLTYGNDGDTLTIGGVDYTILAIHPDGQGLVTLPLEES